MAVIKEFKAVKIDQNHLLGIQDLSFSEASNILKQAKTFITLNKSATKKLDIFCYITKSKQIGLTKKNNLGFLKDFLIPKIRIREKKSNKNWFLLKHYSNSISNKKLDINLYYKF